MKPLADNVLIKKEEPSETTESGLVIQITDKEPINKGEVIKIGEAVIEIKKGDIVLFKPYLFEEIKIDETKYVIGKEENVMLVL